MPAATIIIMSGEAPFQKSPYAPTPITPANKSEPMTPVTTAGTMASTIESPSTRSRPFMSWRIMAHKRGTWKPGPNLP